MAARAVFSEQRPTLGRTRTIDGAQDFFRPQRRFEPLQGLLKLIKIADTHRRRITCVAGQRLALLIEHLEGRADAQGFADVARHRLLGRAIPLHPIEGPDVPQLRVIHGRVGDAVVFVGNRVAETGVGDPAEGIGTARAFFRRVEAAVRVVPGDMGEGVQ